MQVGVATQQRGGLVAAEAVERIPLRRRPQQPVLVGLAVHGHQRLGDLGQLGRGHRGTTDERA